MKVSQEQATWRNMPNKWQLTVIAAARITELLSERSQATYIFYQLQSFAAPGGTSESQAVSQAGILLASWAAAQSIAAVWWGRAANSPRLGRKGVILIGLAGTFVSSLCSGFAKSFNQLLALKVFAGVSNTNLGIMRTMIGETTSPRFESKAFLVFPMCLSIGEVLGPLLGGFLADPSASDSSEMTIPKNSRRGSDSDLMSRFPFALPNFICGLFILLSALMVAFGLDETHPLLAKNGRDPCRRMGQWMLKKLWAGGVRMDRYERLAGEDDERLDVALAYIGPSSSLGRGVANRMSLELAGSSTTLPATQLTSQSPNEHQPRKLLTWRVRLTLLTHFALMLHLSAFHTIIPSFLSAQQAKAIQKPSGLHLAGGLGLSLNQVGAAVAVLSLMGLVLQLLVYPTVVSRMGLYMCYRIFLPFSALAYLFMPFTVLLRKDFWVLLPVLLLLFGFQALSRTFAQPGMIKLINSCGSHPQLRSTIHGIGLSVGSLARIVGPVCSGWILRIGLEGNTVSVAWWGMALAAAVNWFLLLIMRSMHFGHKTPGTS
ncbi:hypothetical protein BFJ63_vAg17303 [Fusarium oxysporum f. sp. narcissi]|uniref:Major facilitator superfamily (MFS) profile domain-containing protein n=1 Tax=Fusarium oxysporum f. sp. narcissi TaxID=451672 RepID=A0A4Q2UZ06_FUSOX|nr:hypothetical protein BFJ63_vAg17303 [Fusarium oxysporum f. sp. narcissi]